MEQTLTTTINTLMLNLCNQLIAFQDAIATRTENPGVPNQHEITLQCKLINCLDKLRRFHGRTTKAKKEKTTNEASTQEFGNETEIGIVSDNAIPSHFSHIPSHSSTLAPVSQQDFTDYKHLLGHFGKLTNTSQIRFRGRYVNAQWLEYNLFQYCLPAPDRRFIHDTQTLLTTINHQTTQERIAEYLKTVGRVAA